MVIDWNRMSSFILLTHYLYVNKVSIGVDFCNFNQPEQMLKTTQAIQKKCVYFNCIASFYVVVAQTDHAIHEDQKSGLIVYIWNIYWQHKTGLSAAGLHGLC